MAIDQNNTTVPDAPFQWGAGGARMTPEEIAARRKVADAMVAQAGDYTPIRSVWQGLARAAQGIVGGMQGHDASEAAKTNASDNAKMIADYLTRANGGVASVASPGPVASAAQAAVPSPAPTSSSPVASPDPYATPDPEVVTLKDGTKGEVFGNSTDRVSSPLDPPSGEDRVKMISTILGEAANEPQIGKNAIASVIRNRAVDGSYGGYNPSAVVTAPNQFEPWSTPEGRARMAAATADPTQRAAAEAAVASAYGEGGKAPEDPTEGMTHFYSPKGQAAMGRPPPAWAGGESVTIGNHVFNSPDDAAPGARPSGVATVAAALPQPVQVASNDPAAIPAAAAPTQGYAIPGQPAPAAAAPSPSPGVVKVAGTLDPNVLRMVTSPYSDPTTKQIGMMALTQQMKPQVAAPYKDADGNLVQKAPDGTVHVLSAADKTPDAVRQYEYARSEAQKAGKPFDMDFSTWSDKKARAAATNVSTKVDTRAETEMSKAVGKAQGEVIGEDIKAGSHAANKLRQLATLDEANKSGGDDISSGPFGKAVLSGKQGLSELTGVDLKGVPESEVIQKVGFGLATNMVKAISNRPSQMEFGKALENVPGLLMSRQGRVAMTSILTQETHAEQEIGRLANNTENHKNWQEVKDKYYAEHPLISPFTGKPFGETDIQMLTKAGGGSATPAAEPKVVNGYTIKELP